MFVLWIRISESSHFNCLNENKLEYGAIVAHTSLYLAACEIFLHYINFRRNHTILVYVSRSIMWGGGAVSVLVVIDLVWFLVNYYVD